jgi:glycosyltransferase involved in cell wall biosynthesis
MIAFSCLISVYSGTVLPFFEIAIESIFKQTVQPNEIIIVKDGAVTRELDEFIDELIKNQSASEIRVLALEENMGAGPARNKAIEKAKYDWIAVMDCDDYALPTRFEKQIAVLHSNPGIDFISSLSDEYADDFQEENFIATKKCPETSLSITRRLNYNCCITNPTIFFRKKVWEKTQGYASFRFLNEDHFFFLKVAKQNFQFYCVQEPLVKVRIGKEQRKRRSGFKLFWTDVKFRYNCFKHGLIDIKGFSMLFPLLIRRFTPPFMLSFAHKLWRSI